jgi:hypothetical protein
VAPDVQNERAMKTTTMKKIALSRETLRRLTGRELDRVAGGRRRFTDITKTCPSVDICPSLDEDCEPVIVA